MRGCEALPSWPHKLYENDVDRLYSVLTSEFLERLVLRCVRRHNGMMRMLRIAADQILTGGRVMQVTETADGHQARDGG